MPFRVYNPMAGKQDTAPKFDEDNVDPSNPILVNMAHLGQVTSLEPPEIEHMNGMIEDWLKTSELDITEIKSDVEKAALRPLIKVLCEQFAEKFMDAESPFTIAVMESVIQRKLSSLRRAADGNIGSQKDSEPATPAVPEGAITNKHPPAPTSNPVPVAVSIKDFGIRARALQHATVGAPDQPPPLSVATIGDVLPDPHLNNDDTINQASFKLWTDLLRQDVDYTESHAIKYECT